MAKRIRSVQVEQVAMEYVKSVFNVMNWKVAELHPDMGLDLNVKPFDNRSESQGLALAVQRASQRSCFWKCVTLKATRCCQGAIRHRLVS